VAGDEASRFQQKRHLQDVIIECAKFGYIIFSHPSEWQFVHREGSSHPGFRLAVVCAGLDKISHKDGQYYQTPHHIVAPTMVQI
jgi:hypothetical protein